MPVYCLFSVNSFTIPTLNNRQSHHVLVHDEVNYFEFYVRTCESAIVWLSYFSLSEDDPQTGYKVVFGNRGNSEVTVYQNSQRIPKAEYPKEDIVSCHAER